MNYADNYKRILFSPGNNLSLFDGRSQYLHTHQHLFAHYRKTAGLKAFEPLPLYGYEIHTLNSVTVENIKKNPSLSWFRALALAEDPHLDTARDRIEKLIEKMDEIYAMGFRLLHVGPILETDWTADKPSRNCCSPISLEPAEALGGWDMVRRLSTSAHKAGLKLMVWIGPHLSLLSPVLAEHPEWVAVDRHGAKRQDADGTFAVMDFTNRDWMNYWLEHLKAWIDAGVDHFFFDSYPNSLVRTLNYAAGAAEGVMVFAADEFAKDKGEINMLSRKAPVTPQSEAALHIHRELEKYGVGLWVEGVSPFGVSSNGANISPDEQRSALMFHSDLRWYFGKEYAAVNTNLRCGPLDFQQIFRFVAFKAPLGQTGKVAQEVSLLYKVYAENVHLMVIPYMLPEDTGVLWLDKSGEEGILFVFAAKKVTHRKISGCTEATGLLRKGNGLVDEQTIGGLTPYNVYRLIYEKSSSRLSPPER